MRALFTLVLLGIVAGCLPTVAVAQVAVTDPATTLRNAVTAVLKERLLATETEQHRRLRRMARRLSMHTSLTKYALADPPRWRTHGNAAFLFTQAYNDALIFGDPEGAIYLDLVRHVVATRGVLDRLPSTARRIIGSQLASMELADATAIAGLHQTGQLRLNGRKNELPAIEALQAHVIDPSNEQSATAVAEKVSGASLIGARQRQARLQFLVAITEQLAVENKRTRDAEAATLGILLGRLRDGREVDSRLIAGAASDLRTWRQP